MKQQLTSSTMVETFKDAEPNTINTCKLLVCMMKGLVEKIMLPTTSKTQRQFLGDIYEAKLKEYKKLECAHIGVPNKPE